MNKYFNCHQCGKCCNSAPALQFNEIEKFYDKFILTTYVKSLPLPPVSNPDLRAHYEDIFYKTQTRHLGLNKQMFLMVFPMGYTYVSLGKCPYLENEGLCGIYTSRPEICKTVPVQVAIPENQQFFYSEQSNVFITQGCLSEEKKENFIPIFEENKLTPGYKNSYSALYEDLRDNKTTIELFYQLATGMGISIVPRDNGYFTVPMIVLLSSLAKLQKLEKRKIKDIFEQQIILLEKAIEDAIIRQNKNDRERTKELRFYLDMYNKTLMNYDNNPLFEN